MVVAWPWILLLALAGLAGLALLRHKRPAGVRPPETAGVSSPAVPAQLGPFRVEHRAAQGRMARALTGTHQQTGERAFIKWVPSLPAGVAGEADQLATETRILIDLAGRGVPAVLDAGAGAGGHWLAMREIAGVDLERTIQAQGPFDECRLQRLLEAMAATLARVHAANWVHADVKPANVMVSPDDLNFTLVDFGLASARGAVRRASATFVGSPAFMAPEMLTTAPPPVQPAIDLYGLGATLWFAATGRPPFVGETVAQTLHAVANEPLGDLRVLAPALTGSLRGQIVCLLHRDPASRRLMPVALS